MRLAAWGRDLDEAWRALVGLLESFHAALGTRQPQGAATKKPARVAMQTNHKPGPRIGQSVSSLELRAAVREKGACSICRPYQGAPRGRSLRAS